MEIFASVCSLCRTNIRRFRRSSIWSVLNEKRKSFSSVTVRISFEFEHVLFAHFEGVNKSPWQC